MKLTKTILFIIVLSHANNSFTFNFGTSDTSQRLNKLKKEATNITRLTKDNIHKFVKTADTFVSTKKNIENIIVTPEKLLLNKIDKKIENFAWSTDEEIINLINNSNNKNLVLEKINSKIKSQHPESKMLILALGADLQKERNTLNKYYILVSELIEKKQKLKVNLGQENLIDYINKINKLKSNIEAIELFLNNLLMFERTLESGNI